MKIWSRLDDEEQFWVCYLFGVLLYAAYAHHKSQRRQDRRERERNRDKVVLNEEALQRLEAGGTVEVPWRWHGGELTLRADEVVLDADQLTSEEETESDT